MRLWPRRRRDEAPAQGTTLEVARLLRVDHAPAEGGSPTGVYRAVWWLVARFTALAICLSEHC